MHIINLFSGCCFIALSIFVKLVCMLCIFFSFINVTVSLTLTQNCASAAIVRDFQLSNCLLFGFDSFSFWLDFIFLLFLAWFYLFVCLLSYFFRHFLLYFYFCCCFRLLFVKAAFSVFGLNAFYWSIFFLIMCARMFKMAGFNAKTIGNSNREIFASSQSNFNWKSMLQICTEVVSFPFAWNCQAPSFRWNNWNVDCILNFNLLKIECECECLGLPQDTKMKNKKKTAISCAPISTAVNGL